MSALPVHFALLKTSVRKMEKKEETRLKKVLQAGKEYPFFLQCPSSQKRRSESILQVDHRNYSSVAEWEEGGVQAAEEEGRKSVRTSKMRFLLILVPLNLKRESVVS